MDSNVLEKEITEFIKNKFLVEDVANKITADTLLLDEQIIDSSGVLVLIMFIEKQYNIEIDDLELVPDNFNSISALVKLVESKLE